MVEHQLPKLVTRVRFPPGAPNVKLASDLRGFFDKKENQLVREFEKGLFMPEENSIKLFIDDIKKCNECGCFFAALIVALALPDICGKVLFPEAKTGERYIKWFDKYIGDNEGLRLAELGGMDKELPYMTGKVCYKLRCTLLHEGTEDIASKVENTDFILNFSKSSVLEESSTCERIDTDENGKEISSIKEKHWKINTVFLCDKIVNGVERFLKEDIKDENEIPKIRLYEIPEIFKDHWKLDEKND